MRLIALFSLVATGLALAQTPAAPQASGQIPLMNLPPETVVATIDGQKVVAGELQAVLRANASAQQVILSDPNEVLRQYGLFRRLAALAEKAGVDQKSPYKYDLAHNRMLALANAQLALSQEAADPSPQEVQGFYNQNKDLYTQAKVRLIYIPFSPNPPAKQDAGAKKILNEGEAKATAEKVYAQLQGGADFVKMVRQYSGDPTSAAKDGDYGSIRKTDQIPPEIKTAIFDLKPGQVSRPVRQPNGFYLFRADEIGIEPFEKVRDRISGDLRNSRINEWVQNAQKDLEIKIENPAAFPTARPPAPPKP